MDLRFFLRRRALAAACWSFAAVLLGSAGIVVARADSGSTYPCPECHMIETPTGMMRSDGLPGNRPIEFTQRGPDGRLHLYRATPVGRAMYAVTRDSQRWISFGVRSGSFELRDAAGSGSPVLTIPAVR